MLIAILTFMYGIGFGLTFIGKLFIIALSSGKSSAKLFWLKVFSWPLTWGTFGYKIWKNDRH